MGRGWVSSCRIGFSMLQRGERWECTTPGRSRVLMNGPDLYGTFVEGVGLDVSLREFHVDVCDQCRVVEVSKF